MGSAGGRAGVGLAAACAVGVGFLGDVRRTGAFFAGFLLTVLVFVRVTALMTGVFLRFPLALPFVPFAFLLVGIYSLPIE
jgi:hypothetical protein